MPSDGLDPSERAYYRNHAAEERDRRDFLAFLEGHEHVYDVSARSNGIDFYVGDPAVYPNHLRHDDHIRMIGRSSIATMQRGVTARHEGRFVTEVKVHLPAAPEGLREAIDDALDLPDGTGVHFGTMALGGMSAPDGIVTPHVYHTEAVSFDVATAAVETAIDAYVDVYDRGERAIQEVPDR